MRTRKIFGLLIPLLQLLLVLKLIEYVRGYPYPYSNIPNPVPVSEGGNKVSYVNSVTFLPPAADLGDGDESSGRSNFVTVFPKHKKKLRPYWTTTEESPILEQVIRYDMNGTEIERTNITRRVSTSNKKNPSPLCPVRFFFWHFCPYDIPILNMFFPKDQTYWQRTDEQGPLRWHTVRDTTMHSFEI